MRLKAELAITTFVFLAFGIAEAQSLSTIVGTVTDPSGAVIPTATVTATEVATSLTRTAISDAQGQYVIPSLRHSGRTWRCSYSFER
jgi:hypothetical protein